MGPLTLGTGGEGLLGPYPQPSGMIPRVPIAPGVVRDGERAQFPRSPPFPKLEFPKFSGSNPRLWKENCEMFFEVYAVDPSLKTRFAALNFQGAAATWLQTVQRRGRVVDWGTLCELVMGKFDKDQYQVLLGQFDALRQSGSVTEYQEEFERLAHGLLLYNNNYDDTYFVTHFVAGLKDEIRRVIALHRPKDVDTASALALMQEEELHRARSKSGIRDYQKGTFRSVGDKSKGQDSEPAKQKEHKTVVDEKLATLREHRKKNGLCYKCGEKWSHTHKCPAQVPLHVIEELLDALESCEADDPSGTEVE